jgi:hypothetical protein
MGSHRGAVDGETYKDRLRLSPLLVQAVLADTGARDQTLS